MHSIRAIYDGVNIKPIQPIHVNENYEVVITFIEPLKKDAANMDQSAKLPRSTALGLWKDKIWMSDDFNEPLEEMKEYME